KLKNDLLQLNSSIKDLGDEREQLKEQKVKQQRVLDSIVKERKTKIRSLDGLKERVDKLQAQQKEYVSANLLMKALTLGYGKQVARELGKTEKTYNDQLQTIEREYEQAKLNCEKQILEITESVYRLQITQEQRQKQKAACLSRIEAQPLSVLGAVFSAEQKKELMSGEWITMPAKGFQKPNGDIEDGYVKIGFGREKNQQNSNMLYWKEFYSEEQMQKLREIPFHYETTDLPIMQNTSSQKTKSKELEETQEEEIKRNRGYGMGR